MTSSRNRSAVGSQMQFDSALRRCDAQPAYQIQPLVVLNTRANHWRLSARCSRPLQGQHQRKPLFIGQNEHCAEFTPLFLSVAKHSVSNEQSLRRPAPNCAAAAFDNSNRSVATHTKHRWNHSALETVPRSHEQYDPTSSNLRHNREQTHRVASPTPNGVIGRPINDWDILAHVSTYGTDVGIRAATDTRSAVSHQRAWQFRPDRVPGVTDPRHAGGAVRVVGMFQGVSCVHYNAGLP